MVKLTESAVYIRTKANVEAVKKLNLWGCDIDDITICERMKNLEVLSLSVNKVDTLESLQNCSKLKELYLRKNNIPSLCELEYLKNLKNLRVLWIDDNPCTIHGDYRSKVIKMLPQLTKLDDKNVTIEEISEHEEPECDMHRSNSKIDIMSRSMYSDTRSINGDMMTRSVHPDLMTRSVYGGLLPGKAIVDTVMQPQIAHLPSHYGESSDDERVSVRETMSAREPPTCMTQSICVPEEEWGDFGFEEEFSRYPMGSVSSRMCMSMHEALDRSAFGRLNGRSISVPRRRIMSRKQSTSPARDQRLSRIMSAVSVLLDELDHDGLRAVVAEAQDRMKKHK